MSIFDRVFGLIRSNFDRTPFEDLTTEFLAGVLESDQELLNSFVNELLQIAGSDYSVFTQKIYKAGEDVNDKNKPFRRIDMVFSNRDNLIFLENKIESEEGTDQLKAYYDILKKEKPEGNYYLRYCTKYYDPKNPEDYGDGYIFLQLRWGQVATFFHNCREQNSLVREFPLFLRRHGMGQIESFKEEDRKTMQSVFTTLEKMHQSLELITHSFEKYFEDIPSKSWAEQLRIRNRYGILSRHGIFIDKSSVFVGFCFDEHLNEEAPVLQVLWWCKPDNDSAILDLAKQEKFKCYNWGTVGIGVSVEEPLSNFPDRENQATEINRWFETKMKMVNQFIANSLKSPTIGN